MKKINFLIYAMVIASFSLAKAQDANELSLVEFYDEICFDNICLNEIIDTHSDLGNIKTLFSNPVLRTRDDNTSKSLDYKIGGYYFVFEELSSSDKDTDYSIAYIWVEDDAKVSIKGISVGIGDNISKLGNIKVLNSGSIAFYNLETNASLNISYLNDKIIEISFVFD